MLAEALVRVPLIYLLPISLMVGISALLLLGTLAVLILWTGWYVRRNQPAMPPPAGHLRSIGKLQLHQRAVAARSA